MVRLLLAKRADTEAKAKHGLTPLLMAASLNDLQSVELLVENSADVDVG